MKQQPSHSWSRVLVILTVVVLAGASALAAQNINVCISFGGSGLTPAEQAQVVAKVQGHYDNAGVGAGNNPGVTVQNASPPPANCNINVSFFSSPDVNYYGRAVKKAHVAVINTEPFGKFTDPDQRCRAMGETIAHEIGHTLCAVHDCKGTGNKGSACDGTPASIMTTGLCVPCSQRGQKPGRTFTPTSVGQIQAGIKRLAAGGANWSLVAAYSVGIVQIVEGQQHLQVIELPDEKLIQEDPMITFHYGVVRGDQSLFEFGWLNEDGEFVEAVAEDLNPDSLLETDGGAYLHFALRGRRGSPFSGQVFPQRSYGTLQFSGEVYDASQAATADIVGPYYSQVTITFNVLGNEFAVHLDSEAWGHDNGFQRTGDEDAVPLDAQPTVQPRPWPGPSGAGLL